jgi:hypothetical protein
MHRNNTFGRPISKNKAVKMKSQFGKGQADRSNQDLFLNQR